MGFFSWKTSDTGKPVRNKFTDRGATPCKMLAPDGREWIERNYQGYGVFGGQDYYTLLAELNSPTPQELDDGDIRDLGIELDFSGDNSIIRPKIVSINCEKAWDDLPESEIDDNQGYW